MAAVQTGALVRAFAPPHVERLSYRIDEAVAATGLSRTKIYELIKSGVLKTTHVGKRTLIPRADLEALVAPVREAA